MVPIRLGLAGRRAAGGCALIIVAACGRRGGETFTDGDTTVAGVAANAVRARYSAADLVAAGAWTWQSPSGPVFVLVDVQSTIDGLVQARAELWAVADTVVERFGRSDVMPAAAEIGAYAFEDLTGDGLPDLYGYVADSAGVSFNVFIPGAVGAMADELPSSAPGWVFSAGEADVPRLVRGAAGACALQLWAESPTPDSQPAGWRYLVIRRDGSLSAPMAQAPDCGTGLQTDSTLP